MLSLKLKTKLIAGPAPTDPSTQFSPVKATRRLWNIQIYVHKYYSTLSAVCLDHQGRRGILLLGI